MFGGVFLWHYAEASIDACLDKKNIWEEI